MMPQTDGWSVLSSLKADPELAKNPLSSADHYRREGIRLLRSAPRNI